MGDQLIESRLHSNDLREFSRRLVAGVRQHRESLDGLIEQLAANWSLKRMATTDRNVLRLGALRAPAQRHAPPRGH